MIIKFFEKNYWLSLLVAFILGGFIYYVSSIDSFAGAGYGGNWIADFYHFSVFFTFSAFFIMGVIRGTKKEWVIAVVIFLLFYALTDEFHQLFVPGRFSSIGDVFIDSAGILLATLIYIAILYYRD